MTDSFVGVCMLQWILSLGKDAILFPINKFPEQNSLANKHAYSYYYKKIYKKKLLGGTSFIRLIIGALGSRPATVINASYEGICVEFQRQKTHKFSYFQIYW